MASGAEQERTYPLKQPKNHKAPIPRWSLHFPSSVSHIYTLYVGVQCHNGNTQAHRQAENVVDSTLYGQCRAPAIDTFRVTNGFDLVDSKVSVAYWTEAEGYAAALDRLNLTKLWNDLNSSKDDVGLWIEHFTAPIERLETNYAQLDHKPGLAQLPDTTQPAHNRTAYWGAGRDRIPASAHDLFPTPEEIRLPATTPQGYGERLTGTNYDNM